MNKDFLELASLALATKDIPFEKSIDMFIKNYDTEYVNKLIDININDLDKLKEIIEIYEPIIRISKTLPMTLLDSMDENNFDEELIEDRLRLFIPYNPDSYSYLYDFDESNVHLIQLLKELGVREGVDSNYDQYYMEYLNTFFFNIFDYDESKKLFSEIPMNDFKFSFRRKAIKFFECCVVYLKINNKNINFIKEFIKNDYIKNILRRNVFFFRNPIIFNKNNCDQNCKIELYKLLVGFNSNNYKNDLNDAIKNENIEIINLLLSLGVPSDDVYNINLKNTTKKQKKRIKDIINYIKNREIEGQLIASKVIKNNLPLELEQKINSFINFGKSKKRKSKKRKSKNQSKKSIKKTSK